MKMEFYRPKNDQLKKYIEGYYFISPEEEPRPLRYWTFPNNFFILSFNYSTEIKTNDHQIVLRRSEEENFITHFVPKYKKPIEIIYEELVNELTVYFKPLGINHFVEKPEIFFENAIGLHFNPFEDLEEIMKRIFLENHREVQCEIFENYWLSKLRAKVFPEMEKIISDIESDLRIDDIAFKNNISRQYLNKLFSKTVGKTPSEFRKINRFRKFIINNKDRKSSGDSRDSNSFYDQSHLIKDFRQLTNLTPNSFFKNVNIEQGNVWLFI